MIENKTGIVILARMSSSRLPAKALRPLEGKESILYIIEKLLRLLPKENIILATSTESSDDPLVNFVEKLGIALYRGSLTNVAERFYQAGLQLNCPYLCRMNGDNIFLDSQLLQSLLSLANSGEYDFISNVKDRTYPKGMSVEIVRTAYYEKLLPEILANDYYTEHVMPLVYERANSGRHYYQMNTDYPDAAGIQLALDTAQDFKRSEWILKHSSLPHTQMGLRELLQLYKTYEQSPER